MLASSPRNRAQDRGRPPVPAPAPGPVSLEEARLFCARLARDHYENFPVASRLVPAPLRPAVQSIYAFARVADDFADEPIHEGRRLERLAEWERMLEGCYRGEAVHPVFVALRDAVVRFELPPEPFHDLLAAFRMDVTTSRYGDFDQLLQYCRLSANPVGRLVLHLFGHRDPVLIGRSNALCTALQLTNHWQDVAIDAGRDRIYLPEDEREHHGVGEEELGSGRVGEGYLHLMDGLFERTRRLYTAARPLCDAVGGRLRLELRLTWLGGWRILDRIERVRFDVFRRRPRLGLADLPGLLAAAAFWGRGR